MHNAIISKLPRDPIDTKRLANACIWTENGGCIKRLKNGQKWRSWPIS